MDSYDAIYAAYLKDFPVSLEPLYRCAVANVVLIPSVPLEGGIRHTCPQCHRTISQTLQEYDRYRDRHIKFDVTCPDG